jgi:hypothetical protein
VYYTLTSSISNGLLALYGSDERIINININHRENFLVTFIQPSNKMATWNRVVEKLILTQVAKTILVF